MKAMILVLSPRESRDLLNGNSSVLVRKRFPKDYVGWVYVCVAKDERKKLVSFSHPITGKTTYVTCTPKEYLGNFKTNTLNGKVVARFWCDKVEEICFHMSYNEHYNGYMFENRSVINDSEKDLLKESCLTKTELYEYLEKTNEGYAIHVTKPKPFDKPKEINEFYHHFSLKRCERRFSNTNIEIDDKTGGLRQPTKHGYEYVYPLTSVPRSGWCYVEVS